MFVAAFAAAVQISTLLTDLTSTRPRTMSSREKRLRHVGWCVSTCGSYRSRLTVAVVLRASRQLLASFARASLPYEQGHVLTPHIPIEPSRLDDS